MSCATSSRPSRNDGPSGAVRRAGGACLAASRDVAFRHEQS
jgi:hypothetical protein